MLLRANAVEAGWIVCPVGIAELECAAGEGVRRIDQGIFTKKATKKRAVKNLYQERQSLRNHAIEAGGEFISLQIIKIKVARTPFLQRRSNSDPIRQVG